MALTGDAWTYDCCMIDLVLLTRVTRSQDDSHRLPKGQAGISLQCGHSAEGVRQRKAGSSLEAQKSRMVKFMLEAIKEQTQGWLHPKITRRR